MILLVVILIIACIVILAIIVYLIELVSLVMGGVDLGWAIIHPIGEILAIIGAILLQLGIAIPTVLSTALNAYNAVMHPIWFV